MTCTCEPKRPMTEPGASILAEAIFLVNGSRAESYGDPSELHSRVATIWSAVLGFPVTRDQVALCMIGLKLARQAGRPKRDNLVDIAGWAEIAHRMGRDDG